MAPLLVGEGVDKETPAPDPTLDESLAAVEVFVDEAVHLGMAENPAFVIITWELSGSQVHAAVEFAIMLA